MKKRVLSLLLLVVMLVTMIPVSSVAAEETVEQQTVTTKEDLLSLYAAQDNLTAFYTAMDETLGGVDLANGTWTSLVGSGKITLGNYNNDKVNWTHENKAVGVVSTWGYYDQANEKYYIGTETEEDGTTLTAGAQIALKYNNNDIFNTQLTFGLSQLPADDYTLEYVANFGYTMMVDANGNPFINGIDVPGALDTHSYSKRYNADGTSNNSYGYGGGHYQGSVDFIGAANSVTGYRDAYFTDNPGYYGYTRGKVFWFFVNAGWAPMWNATQGGYPGRILSVKGDDWQTRDQIRTYTMTRDEFDGFKADGTTANRNATYSFIRDGVVYQSYTDNYNNYTGSDYSGTFFYLGNRCTVDYYTVRIYDKVLSAEEIAQNHAADIIVYYGLDVKDEWRNDATKWAAVIDALSSATIVTGSDDTIAAKKAEYQAAIANTVYAERRAEILSYYAAQDNLTAFYTADEVGKVDLANGTWTSLVGSGKIALGNYNNDKVNWTWENKSVGVVQTWGSYIDGVFSQDSETALLYNNNDINHTKLDFGISQLPTGDYTIEYVAKYGHVMSVDATGKPVQVNIELADVVAAGTHSYESEWYYNSYDDGVRGGWGAGAYDFIGFIQNVAQSKSDDNNWASAPSYYGYGYGRGVWFIGTQYWWAITSQGGMFPIATDYVRANQWHDRTQIVSYAITRSVVEGTHSYALLRNGETYQSNSKEISENEKNGRFDFFLGNRITGNYYGVRIYDKVLTAEEIAQNHAADIIVYYGLSVKDEWREDALAWSTVVNALADATIVADGADTIAAKKAEYQASVNDAIYTERRKEILSLYAAQENLTAFYTADEAGKVDLANGTWTSLVGSGKITLGNYNNDKVNWTHENKSVGIIQTWGSYIDGVFTETSEYNNNDINHTQLTLGRSQLPSADYTIEYVANIGYVMAVDADGKPVCATTSIDAAVSAGTYAYASSWDMNANDTSGNDAAGNKIRYGDGFVDMFGMIASGSTEGKSDSYFANAPSSYGSYRGKVVWMYAVYWWGSAWNQSGRMKTSGSWQQRGETTTYTVTRETYTLEDGKRSAVYGFMQNGVAFDTYDRGTSGDHDPNGHLAHCDFYIGNRVTADYYGVRIYNKALTGAEVLQNRYADLLVYYDIIVPDTYLENIMNLGHIFAERSTTPFEKDATAYATVKAELQAEINAAVDTIPLKEAALKLYVQDGLTAFYTAMGALTNINLTAGTWTSLVGSGIATLGNHGVGNIAWVKGDKSVGITQIHGSYVDNTFSNTVTEYETFQTVGTSLNFGIAQMPKDDYTVEFLAKYRNIMTVDADGNIVGGVYELGGKTMAFAEDGVTESGQQYFGSQANAPVDQIGHLAAWTTNRDGYHSSFGGEKGHVMWTLSAARWGWGGANAYGFGITSGAPNLAFNTRNVIRNYAISRDLTTTVAEDETTSYAVAYNFYQDMNTFLSKTRDDLSFASEGGYFYLAERLSVDFYAVRIYSKALTVADLQRNHMADMVAYYGLTIPDDVANDGEKLAQLASSFISYGYEEDTVQFAVKKAELQDIITDFAAASNPMRLYVTDGLVANYTALTANDTTASVKGGVWANRVAGGPSATLASPNGVWHKNANGSVGMTQIYGSYIDGAWSETSAYDTLSTTGSRLVFDKSLILSSEDFTVEYVAEYRNIMSADAEGNLVGGVYALGGTTPGSSQYGENATAPVDQYGFLRSWTTNRDGRHSTYGGNGLVVWTTSSVYWGSNSWQGIMGANHSTVLFKNGEVAFTRNVVGTYAISRDLTVTTAEDETTTYAAEYQLYKAGSSMYSASNEAGTDYSGELSSASTLFYIGERLSVDFYAVRVYQKVLSAKEMAQNHLADIIIYYGLTLPVEAYDDTAKIEKLSLALRQANIVNGSADEKAAKKAEYAAIIASVLAEEPVEKVVNYDELYVQDGLVGLFTAFAGDTSIDMFDGTWTNKVADGAAASLKGASYWTRETVGVSTTMDYDKWQSDAGNFGITLPAEYENLDNFTVEAFAAAKGITDENGNRVTRGGATFNGGFSSFRFGLLMGTFFNTIEHHHSESINIRWMLYNTNRGGGEPTSNVVSLTKEVIYGNGTTATDLADVGWRMGNINTPVVGVMQASKVTSGDNITYSLKYNGSANEEKGVTVTAAKHAELIANVTNRDPSGRFSLFNGTPSDVYAIRVYNRELTAAEKLQNSFVDKAGFYQIDVTGFKDLDDETKQGIYERFATVSTTVGAASAQAIYDFYVNGDAGAMAQSMIAFDSYQPIKSGAYGYRALFTLSTETLDLLETNGYSVSYGAIVAAGGSFNAIEDVVITSFDGENVTAANNMQVITVDGHNGSRIFYDYPNNTLVRYSAAVTTTDAAYFGTDIIVRGYVAIKRGDETHIAYVDGSADTVFGASASICDVADYYVNSYEGNPVDMYAYMNSQTLRYILTASGMTAHRVPADDIVLYVDGVNGSDANTGMAMGDAFKTLDAAYEATVAHFNTAGIKGVTIHIAEGTVQATKTFSLNKNELVADDCYLNIVGAGASKTTISGEVAIDFSNVQYTEDDKGVEYIDIPGKPSFRALYGDGALLNIARKGDSENYMTVTDFAVVDASGNELTYKDHRDGDDWQVSDADADKAAYAVFTTSADGFDATADYKGTELHFIVVWGGHTVVVDHVDVVGDKANIYVKHAMFADLKINSGHEIVGVSAWLENSYAVLEAFSDTYYYDDTTGRLYFAWNSLFLSGFNTLTYAGLEQAFAFENFNNVSITGVTFAGLDSRYIDANAGVGISLSQSSNSRIVKEDGTAGAEGFMTAAAIYAKNIDGLYVDDIAVVDALGGGVLADGVVKNVTVKNSRFENLGETAVRFGTGAMYNINTQTYSKASYVKNVAVTNNFINKIGQLYKSSVGIHMTTAANAIVANNTVTNVPYSGMTFGWLWGNINQNIPEIGTTGHYNLFNLEIAYNFISDYNLCTGDGGAIYTLGSSTKNENDFVNYMHHNYVHMTDESGKFYDGRFFMGYYHDNTSSNWLNFENVLISSMTGALYSTMPIYNQDIVGAQAFNNHFVDNYIIGFDRAAVVYNDATNFLEKHNNAAHDYLFTSVANLKANTAKANDTIYYTEDGVNKAANILTKAAPADAVGTVANIFATAGSTYGASTKVSGLGNVTGTAFDAKLLLDYETSEISITGAKAFTATFTCDGVATSIFAMAGDALKVPSIYSEAGYAYTFSVDGEEIDVENYVMPAKDLAVTVTRTAIDYTVTVSDGTALQEFTANVGDTLTFDEAAFAHDGYITIYKVEGVAIDLATFTMPASDVKITVTYEAIPYTVTFTYEVGSSVLMEDITIGTKLTAPKGKDKTGYALVYYVDGEKINLSTYTTPAQDVVIEARYEAKTYDVKFYYDIEKDSELYATVKVKFGEAITLPEAPADFTVGDYVYSFESWKGYTEGMILDTEGASFVMKTTATAVAPEFAVGDVNGDGFVNFTDVAVLTAYCANTLEDVTLVLGDTDYNGDGFTNFTDVAELTAYCANSSAE